MTHSFRPNRYGAVMALSAEKVTELLGAAVKAVKDAKVPDDLRPEAFKKAFDAMLGPGSSPNVENGSGGGNGNGEVDPPDESTANGKIAAALGIGEADVEETFAIDGDELDLTVTRGQLNDDRATAVQEVGLLVASARQAAGIDQERTLTKVIRAQADELGIVAKNSFQSEMDALSGSYASSKGTGASRELKIKRSGYDEAKQLIRRVLGEEQ